MININVILETIVQLKIFSLKHVSPVKEDEMENYNNNFKSSLSLNSLFFALISYHEFNVSIKSLKRGKYCGIFSNLIKEFSSSIIHILAAIDNNCFETVKFHSTLKLENWFQFTELVRLMRLAIMGPLLCFLYFLSYMKNS